MREALKKVNIAAGYILNNLMPDNSDTDGLTKEYAQHVKLLCDSIRALNKPCQETENECDEWLQVEGVSFVSPEAYYATKAFMAARGFEWPENNQEARLTR